MNIFPFGVIVRRASLDPVEVRKNPMLLLVAKLLFAVSTGFIKRRVLVAFFDFKTFDFNNGNNVSININCRVNICVYIFTKQLTRIYKVVQI
jgi:hypothetical protein